MVTSGRRAAGLPGDIASDGVGPPARDGGDTQDRFFDWAEAELLPELRTLG